MTLKSSSTTLIASVLILSACATQKEPTFGDIMEARGAESEKIGKNWNKGQKLIKEGKAKIKKGKAKVRKGKNLIDDGENMLEEGQDLVAESEAAFEKIKLK